MSNDRAVAEEFTRSGMDRDVDMVRVLKPMEDTFVSLEDGEPSTQTRMVNVNEMTKDTAFDVLEALADLYEYDLEPK